jgi:hypothetical protein
MTRRAQGNRYLLVAAAALALAQPARSFADDGTTARADQLFNQGKQLLEKGDYAAACPLLADSFRLDPATGALLALALCHEREGKLASARREYIDAAARSKKEGRADRERAANERAAALAGDVSTLTIEHAASDGPSADLQLRLDGALLESSQFGAALPVDGGEHTIEAAAPGRKPFRAHVAVAPRGDAKTVVVPALEGEPSRPLAREVPAPERPSPVASAAGVRDRDAGGGWNTEEWVGISILGAGIVGIGVGSVFAVQAADEADLPAESCTDEVCTYRDTGSDAADAAVLSFVTGGILAASGLAIFLASGSSSSSTAASTAGASLAGAWASPHGAGASVRGRF